MQRKIVVSYFDVSASVWLKFIRINSEKIKKETLNFK